MLENVWLTVYRQDDRALVGMRLVEGADSPPHILAGAADAIMIIERAFEHKGLLNLGILVHGQRGTRRPFEQAGHLALLFVLIEDLDRDASKLRRGPIHVLWFDVG